MKLSTLCNGLALDARGSSASDTFDPDIWSLCEDSRRLKQGALFFARSGTKSDGRAFIDEAIAKGAVAIMVAQGTPMPESINSARASSDGSTSPVAWLTTSDPAGAVAMIAERFSGAPTQTLDLIGVTGTNGKTTITYLVQQLLEHAGVRCGLVGTVEIFDGRERVASALTTPPAIQLSELFARMLDNGCRAAAMEVSSHALDQKRVAGLHFRTAIFTNLTGDHLDYHETMNRYAEAKSVLFRMLDSNATMILNMDDPWHVTMMNAIGEGARPSVLRTSLSDPRAECLATVHRAGLDAMDVTFRGPWGAMEIKLPLVGTHNAMNALQATAAAWSRGLDASRIEAALRICRAPPGRLQPVAMGEQGFSVLVDYAHSDDALANVLRALRPTVPAGGRLRVVFGCGGDRDRSKRPRMARVACEGADQIIVTSDNPRTEDAQLIINEILEGVPAQARTRVEVECDRAKAIAMVVSTAREGDIILIAGKGHEDYQIIGETKHSFDDRLEAESALRMRACK
ncbi:MAG: UDP-N-acetylmuramoyl-L-alanyl-D-glutamate--2,6-diaminopimelate ligase [Planctomycetota bacterium]|nr:MAG: UDP-N-acetylmuramoyl-L-alanyl-D-glutamate--2,6-diaminopimelate ligase [Planctomycetota bacterium]